MRAIGRSPKGESTGGSEAASAPAMAPLDVSHLPHVLTVEEYAAIFRLDVKTVREDIAAGRIRASRFGRRGVIRIPRGEVVSRLQGRVLPAGGINGG